MDVHLGEGVVQLESGDWRQAIPAEAAECLAQRLVKQVEENLSALKVRYVLKFEVLHRKMQTRSVAQWQLAHVCRG